MNPSFEHVSVVPPRLVRNVPKLGPEWLDRFSEIDSTDIADQVGRLYTMEGIHPLYRPIKRAVGRALTVKAWPGDGLAVHGAASLAEDGDLMVVDMRGELGVTSAGFRMMTGPRLRGVRGFVVDGALRDVDEFRQVEFPVFGRAETTHSSTKRRPGEINVPVACGGVIVEPGDLVVADVSGVVVVPHRHIEAVWEAINTSTYPSTDPDAVAAADEKRWNNYHRALTEEGGLEMDWEE